MNSLEIGFERRVVSTADCSRVLDFLSLTETARYSVDRARAAWPGLIRDGVLKAVWIEGRGGRIVSVGASVFIQGWFAAQLRRGAEPGVAATLMGAIGAPTSAVLTKSDIGRATATNGLDVFILHTGVVECRISDRQAVTQIRAQLMTGFMETHAGHNIRDLLVEVFDPEEESMYVDGASFRILNRYRELRDETAAQVSGPCLLGLTRDDVQQLPVHPLMPFFQAHPAPRCCFAESERTLLRVARGQTDELLACELALPISAVKRRWVRIFKRVQDAGLQQLANVLDSPEDHRRGAQKRHLVLEYVRQHPEELVPYVGGHQGHTPDPHPRRQCAAQSKR